MEDGLLRGRPSLKNPRLQGSGLIKASGRRGWGSDEVTIFREDFHLV